MLPLQVLHIPFVFCPCYQTDDQPNSCGGQQNNVDDETS